MATFPINELKKAGIYDACPILNLHRCKATVPNVKAPIAPGISFGNPGQLNAAEFVTRKKQNETAASTFMQIINKHNDSLTDIIMRLHRSDSGVLQRHRSDSGVSDITMKDEFEGTIPHYHRHYQLEEGEII